MTDDVVHVERGVPKEIRRRNFRRVCVVAGLLLWGLAATVIAVIALAQLADLQAGQASARAASARTDCRSIIAAARNDILAGVTLDKAAADHAFYAWLNAAIAQSPDTPHFLAAFRDSDAVLATSVLKARQLPKFDDVVDHGGIIDGMHFAPCPKV